MSAYVSNLSVPLLLAITQRAGYTRRRDRAYPRADRPSAPTSPQDDQLAAAEKIEASVELSRSDRFWVEWMLPLTRPL